MAHQFVVRKLTQYEFTLKTIITTKYNPHLNEGTLKDYLKQSDAIKNFMSLTIKDVPKENKMEFL